MPRPLPIDKQRLTELWNREPHMALKDIAKELSTPTLTLSPQSVSAYAHRLKLKPRIVYNTRPSGSPRNRGTKAGRGQMLRKPLEKLMKRCGKCCGYVQNLATHVCPDPRMVEAARRSYCS